MFNRLAELITLVSKTKVQRVEIVGEKHNYNSAVQRLYQGIHNGDFTSDEDAAKALYNSNPAHEAYRQLKYKLEKRLINTLFHIDISNAQYSSHQIAHYTCHRNTAAVAILAGKGASKNAIAIAERTLRIALMYEFTSIALELANKLQEYYCINISDNKKYLTYNDVSKKQMKLLVAENTAANYKRELMFLHSGRTGHDDTHLEKAIQYTEELKELFKTHQSHQFALKTFNVFTIRYELANDYHMVVKECDKAIEYFENKDQAQSQFRLANFLFSYKKVNAYTTLKDYKQGEEAAIKCLDYAIDGGINWYRALEYYIILCLHDKQYQKAYDLYIKAISHKKFKGLHPEYRELWIIYEAYIHYFIRHEKISIKTSSKGKFRIRKFLNSVPIYSKDKRGLNISILILHVLFLLDNKKYEKIINRVEYLKSYVNKNLVKGETYRSSCFVKMLIALIEGKFNKTATIRKAEPFVEKLKQHPLNKSKQASNVEIVPYEDLWDCIMESIVTNFWHMPKKR